MDGSWPKHHIYPYGMLIVDFLRYDMEKKIVYCVLEILKLYLKTRVSMNRGT